MPHYRVTFEGYIEDEFDSAKDAKDDFIDMIIDDRSDQYGRHWVDQIAVEEFDEKTGKWK